MEGPVGQRGQDFHLEKAVNLTGKNLISQVETLTTATLSYEVDSSVYLTLTLRGISFSDPRMLSNSVDRVVRSSSINRVLCETSCEQKKVRNCILYSLLQHFVRLASPNNSLASINIPGYTPEYICL